MTEQNLIPVISLWRPWANWVALEWKTIETRRHNRFKSLVGKRIGIHAAIKWDKDWLLHAQEFLSDFQIRQTERFLNIGGALICTALVTEGRLLTSEDSSKALVECVTQRQGLILSDVRGIEAVPMKGSRSIWNVPRRLLKEPFGSNRSKQ